MRFGCCTNMLMREPGSIGEEYLGILADLGYDYVELPLGEISLFSRERLRETKALLNETLPVGACNHFFPSDIHLCGENPTPMDQIKEYYKRALAYAAELETPVAVFGSPWSKMCPEGFPKSEAFRQLAEVCRMLGDEVEQYEMSIALEPNNKLETNMLNTYSEVIEMIEAVNHPRILGLQDYFHLKQEEDTVESLYRGRNYLIHTHFARFEGRGFPKSPMEDDYYTTYFRALKEIGYKAGCSMEGFLSCKENFRQDAADTLAFFRSMEAIL